MLTSNHLIAASAASLALLSSVSGQYSATYTPSATGLPKTTENGQAGTNDCGTANSQTSMCQNFYINDITDFCVWAPPQGGGVADHEGEEVSYCTKAGRGTRLIPAGTITGAHFVKTPSYVQVTGEGDFTKIGITAGDEGGELDPHGATGVGNPVGGLVFHNGVQMHEWFSFMSANDFCIRACYDGDRATSLCRHTYDVLGCGFNAPGNYAPNVFETCDGDDAQDIMYGYPGLASFQQDDTSRGVAVPSPHPAPASSNCVNTVGAALAGTAAVSPTSTATSSATSSTTTSSSAASATLTTSTTSRATAAGPSLASSPFGTGSSVSAQPASTQAANNRNSGETVRYSALTAPIVLAVGTLAVFAAAF